MITGNTGNIARKGKKTAVDFVVATGASPGASSKKLFMNADSKLAETLSKRKLYLSSR